MFITRSLALYKRDRIARMNKIKYKINLDIIIKYNLKNNQ